MRKSAMTTDALPHCGTAAAPFRVAIALALAAVSAGMMSWGGAIHCVSASELGLNAAGETPMTLLEDRVAALAAELAQVKAENAKLRESQSDTSEELSYIRARLANDEIRLEALRTTIDENEAHRRITGAEIASNLSQLKHETLQLRNTETEIGSLRASVANSEIGVDSLRATTGEIREQIELIEAARNTTGSIAKSHKHQGHKKRMAQR
jgi:chromosome segregation ATPase